MSKGPSGNTTTTTINPTQQAQTPYLTQGWSNAQNLAQTNPVTYYPGQTLAQPDSFLTQGYGLLGGMNTPLYNVANTAGRTFENAVGGGMGIGNSPAYGPIQTELGAGNTGLSALSSAAMNGTGLSALSNLASNGAGTAALGGLAANGTGTAALGNLASNPTGYGSLANFANGSYLNPGSNPYLSGMFSAAAQPVINSYMTATAPQTDSAMEMAGRYGSGALANAQSQNQLNLGTTLGNLASNLYGTNYENALGLTEGAAGQLGNLAAGAAGQLGGLQAGAAGQLGSLQGGAASSLGNLATGAASTLGGLGNSALGTLESGYEAGNSSALKGLLLEPQVQSGFTAAPNAEVTAGEGLTNLSQQQINDAMSRYYGTQQAPWQTLSQYLSAVGQPLSGSATLTQPYFQNQAANALGLGLGGLGLYNGLTGAGLLGGGAAATGAAAGGAAAGGGLDALGSLLAFGF